MRKKIELKLIEDLRVRRQCFKKRSQGLVKKMSELSILCDVNTSLIVFSGQNDPQPTIWPNNQIFTASLDMFHETPEGTRGRKEVDQETYIKESVEKMEEKLDKQTKKNNEIQRCNLINVYTGRTPGEELNYENKHLLYNLLIDLKGLILKRKDYFEKGARFRLGAEVIEPRSWDEWFDEMATSFMDLMVSEPNDNNVVGDSDRSEHILTSDQILLTNQSIEEMPQKPSENAGFNSPVEGEEIVSTSMVPMFQNSLPFSDFVGDISTDNDLFGLLFLDEKDPETTEAQIPAASTSNNQFQNDDNVFP